MIDETTDGSYNCHMTTTNTLIIVLLVIASSSSCAPPSVINNSCMVSIGGRIDDRFNDGTLKPADLQKAVNAAMDVASLATDYRLMDQTENCRALVGYAVYTRPPGSYRLGTLNVLGHTECWFKTITVAEPATGLWVQHSAIVHELIHAMQKCDARLPVDPGLDPDHANWNRDNIFEALSYVRTHQ